VITFIGVSGGMVLAWLAIAWIKHEGRIDE